MYIRYFSILETFVLQKKTARTVKKSSLRLIFHLHSVLISGADPEKN